MAFRNVIIFFLILQTVLIICVPSPTVDEYLKQRRKLIKQSEKHAIGGNLTLEGDETKVNTILIAHKNKEFKESYKHEKIFPAGMHFFKAKPYIEKSCVFKIIQKLPKGASLHSHDTALVSQEYVFENLTYRDHLYAEDNKTGPIGLKFFKKDPGPPWKPISEVRQEDKTFNDRLAKGMTLVTENPLLSYPHVKDVWTAFQNLFYTVAPLVTYKPVFRDYFYQTLQELHDDNIRYLEVRVLLPPVYDLEGKNYGPEEVVAIYYETSRDFMKDHPDFWGVKLIFAPMRFTTNDVIESYVDFFKKMNEKYPNFVIGFDLVGWEDVGPPLKDFISALLDIKPITKFFFHAGETTWSGLPPDLNLFDAVLLNSSRIGHGYAAMKHPEILKIIKEKGIALEISPISNQVLMLVQDLRNHPANFLIANNYPVVITPDDPGLWGAKGVSYDWYYALMAMANRHSDLRLLKQLAINSILYSSMDDELKKRAMLKWKEDWQVFLKDIISGDLANCKSF